MKTEITLVLATEEDAGKIHDMKYKAFLPLYEKYHDDDTNPAMERIEKVIWKIKREGNDYYLIYVGEEVVGAICIVQHRNADGFASDTFKISPLFVLPEFQNRGIGCAAILKVFEKYPQARIWTLDTIKQEEGNCYLYEKCGFVRVGVEKTINEAMTLVDYEKRL